MMNQSNLNTLPVNLRLLPLEGPAFHLAVSLWNESAGCKEIPHKELSNQAFASLFTQSDSTVFRVGLAAVLGTQLLGFASGSWKWGEGCAFLTFVLVAPSARRKGIGTALVSEVESVLATTASGTGVSLTTIDVRFLNPSALEWVVPGTNGHDHPNAPGVDISGSGILFMKNIGYRDLDTINSFYRVLNDFSYSPAIEKTLEEMDASGLHIVLHDASRHEGMEDLLEDLGSEVWKETLLTNAARPDGGLPVLIVEDGNRVCGFAGPMAVQPSGRGYFNGIGIHSSYRRRGAGKALFSGLCMTLKEMGAGFMTLFTGETNPARNIYESAGFKIVKTWICMRKTLQEDSK